MRKIALIAAVSSNGVIGVENRLPWRLPGDLAQFKALTMGHAVVMGRKTFDSIGRALPGRRTIVVTRRRDWRADGVEVAHSLEDALARAPEDDEVFVAGGAEIFLEALPRADRIYLTRVEADVEGGVRFPPLDPARWRVVEDRPAPRRATDEHPYRFQVLMPCHATTTS